MKKGNKAKTELILLKTLKELQKSTAKQTHCFLKLAVIKHYTVLMLKTPKARKFRSANARKILIPFVLRKKHRVNTALNGIIARAKQKSSKKFFLLLKEEILTAVTSSTPLDATIHEDVYKLAFLKKNFAHYRWF